MTEQNVQVNMASQRASLRLPALLARLAKHNEADALTLLQAWGECSKSIFEVEAAADQKLYEHDLTYIKREVSALRITDHAAASRITQAYRTQELLRFQVVELLRRIERSNIAPTLTSVEYTIELVKADYAF